MNAQALWNVIHFAIECMSITFFWNHLLKCGGLKPVLLICLFDDLFFFPVGFRRKPLGELGFCACTIFFGLASECWLNFISFWCKKVGCFSMKFAKDQKPQRFIHQNRKFSFDYNPLDAKLNCAFLLFLLPFNYIRRTQINRCISFGTGF